MQQLPRLKLVPYMYLIPLHSPLMVQRLTSYEADVDTDADYTPDHEVVSDGYFHESEYRSAPYFNVQIDGINLLDTAF